MGSLHLALDRSIDRTIGYVMLCAYCEVVCASAPRPKAARAVAVSAGRFLTAMNTNVAASPHVTPHQALKKYWGYDEFRTAQQGVIEAVLAGRGTHPDVLRTPRLRAARRSLFTCCYRRCAGYHGHRERQEPVVRPKRYAGTASLLPATLADPSACDAATRCRRSCPGVPAW
jgi:hypothetical protein